MLYYILCNSNLPKVTHFTRTLDLKMKKESASQHKKIPLKRAHGKKEREKKKEFFNVRKHLGHFKKWQQVQQSGRDE